MYRIRVREEFLTRVRSCWNHRRALTTAGNDFAREFWQEGRCVRVGRKYHLGRLD